MTERITSDFDAGKPWSLIERDKPYSQVYRRLEEYETAEEEGRLYILPHGVNVGDCVHAICRFMRDKASTIGINRIMCSEIPMIGRIVSPSHEEIKKVLEKMPKSDSNSESQQLEIKVCRYEKEKT